MPRQRSSRHRGGGEFAPRRLRLGAAGGAGSTVVHLQPCSCSLPGALPQPHTLARLLQTLCRARVARGSLPHHCCPSVGPGREHTILPIRAGWLAVGILPRFPQSGNGWLSIQAWGKKEWRSGEKRAQHMTIQHTVVRAEAHPAKMHGGGRKNVTKLCRCEGSPQMWHRVTYFQRAAAATSSPQSNKSPPQLMGLTPKAGYLGTSMSCIASTREEKQHCKQVYLA